MTKVDKGLAKERPHVYRAYPSKVLQQRGIVVEDSYYLVEHGEIVFEDRSTFACTFEIAYMQDASAWAVAYVKIESMEQAYEFRQNHNWYEVSRLKGIESVWERMVEAEIYSSQTQTGLPEWGGVRILFRVSRYKISYEHTELDSPSAYFFDLVNLPLDEDYSPRYSVQYARLDAAKNLGQVRLDAGIKALLESPAEQNDEEKRAAAYQAAEDAEKELQSNSAFLMARHIPLDIDGSKLGELYWNKKAGDLSYPIEITCTLRLWKNKIPDSWSPEVTATWICNLLSITLGYDIKWLRWTTEIERGQPPIYEVWGATDVGLEPFYAFAEKPKDAQLVRIRGLNDTMYENTFKFVTSTLSKLFEQDMEKSLQYHKLIYYYILYSSTPSPSVQIKYTLLSVMAEEIYNIWTRVEHRNYADGESQDRRERRSNLKLAARKGIDDVLCLLYPPQQSETPELYKARLSELRKYIKQQVSRSFSSTLDQRLLWFMGENGYNGSGMIKEQIRLFVKSRNTLAHKHKFHCETSDQLDINKEIENIDMIIPLMLALALGYRGSYWDKWINCLVNIQ